MDDEALDELTASIAAHGQREPILLHLDGRILDGRNRHRACLAAGVEPVFRVFEGADDDALRLVVDLNSVRRHLTPSQKSVIAARLATYSHGGNRRAHQSPQMTQAEAAARVGVSERLVRDGKLVLEHGDAELTSAVAEGILAVRKAAEIIRAGGKERLLVSELHRLRRTSKSDEWRTPRHIIEMVTELFGTIDLDPASNSDGDPWVPAMTHFTKSQDGLAQPWRGRVFVNPPWSVQAHPTAWVRKLIAEVDAGNVQEAILLVPSRTNTEWTALLNAYLRCHVRGRLHFNDGPGASAFATALFYVGPQGHRFADVFSRIGDVFGPVRVMDRCSDYRRALR